MDNSTVKTAKVKEIFSSIQGEGPYVGVKQLFIRFCGCNLNCDYCDTDSTDSDYFDCTAKDLKEQIEKFDLKAVHSISLTGGEPLIWAGFLKEFLPLLSKGEDKTFSNKIYLETNSTLNTKLEEIVDLVDIISADIKLPSASGIENSFAVHDEFFKMAKKYNKEIFAKIVFDDNILDNEISNCLKLAEKFELPLVLQPKMDGDVLTTSKEKIFEVFNKFLAHHQNTRVIPQVHKFMRVE